MEIEKNRFARKKRSKIKKIIIFVRRGIAVLGDIFRDSAVNPGFEGFTN
jgi:hypothetical protein